MQNYISISRSYLKKKNVQIPFDQNRNRWKISFSGFGPLVMIRAITYYILLYIK